MAPYKRGDVGSRCGYALDSETTAELEDEAASDVKQSYAQTDADTQDKIDTIDALLDDSRCEGRTPRTDGAKGES